MMAFAGSGDDMSELGSPPPAPSGKLNYLWRILATGLCYFAFGLSGLLLGVVVFPLLNLVVRNPLRRRWARRFVQKGFAIHIELMRVMGVLTYEIRGRERLQREGLLILANHPTLIDVMFLVSLLPNADCVAKPSLARNLFTRGTVSATGYVHSDEGHDLIDKCIASVRSGSTLVIFPEGTRTRRGAPLPLQRGAANIAVRGHIDVTPVRLSCVPMTLGKGEKWYHIPWRRFHFVVDVQPDLEVAPFLDGGHAKALAARRLTAYLTEYFAAEDLACSHSYLRSSN